MRDPVSLVVGASAAQLIGGLVAQMAPFVVSGLMRGLSLSEQDAGLVLTIELLALGFAAIAIAPILPRLSGRRVAFAGVALTLIAQCASVFSASWASLVALRAIAGVGEGVLWAVSLSVVAARSSNPDKVYSYFQVVWALGSVALFAIGGEITYAFAHRGTLAFIAGVTLALAPLLLFMPSSQTIGNDAASQDVERASILLGIMTLSAIGLFLIAGAAVYAFSAPMGERAGLDTRGVGYALALASFLGLSGAWAATKLNVRWGRAMPVLLSCAGFSVVVLVLCLWRDFMGYLFALVASLMIYYFSTPYFFGLAAALDRTGRWAAAAGSIYLLGFAAGPLVAGTAIAVAGYTGLAVVCIGIMIPVCALAIAVNRRLGAVATPATSEPLSTAGS
jgi:predicted MFS family arabinose efflux permease